MKKILCAFLLFSFVTPFASAAEENTRRNKKPSQRTEQKKRMQEVEEEGETEDYSREERSYGGSSSYGRNSRAQLGVELLGAGVPYSLFGSYLVTDNLALNAGISYFSVTGTATSGNRTTSADVSLLTLPLSVSYLFGGPDHHFEILGGLTPIFASGEVKEEDGLSDKATSSGVIFYPGLGYRYWPADGGFHFRATAYGMVAGGSFFPWLGLSFGYAFQ